MKQLRILVGLILITQVLPAFAGSEGIPATEDWAQVSAEAQAAQSPIILVFTAEACSYCEQLAHDVLIPLQASDEQNKPIIKAFDISTGNKIIDFDGSKVRGRNFISRYTIFATPTVVILDSQGKQLAAPIVGYNSKDEYLILLNNAIDSSRTAMQDIELPEKVLAGTQ